MFEFENDEIKSLFVELIQATDGTENCFDPALVPEEGKPRMLSDSITDQYVENWTNRGVTAKTAAKMCAGCPVLQQCHDYAMAAKEPFGIWGGTNPAMRGIKPKFKG